MTKSPSPEGPEGSDIGDDDSVKDYPLIDDTPEDGGPIIPPPYGPHNPYSIPIDSNSADLYAWGPERKRIGRHAWGSGPSRDFVHPPRIDAGPLRVVHAGPCLNRGGAEQWLIELTRFLDPDRVQVVRTIATEPNRVDREFARSLPIPHENTGVEGVRRAIDDADVLLCWGLPMDEVFGDGPRPGLCVFVAHGDGPFTKHLADRGADHIDHYVAVSERVRRTVCFGKPSTVIYNGVDSARLAKTRPRDEVRRHLGFGPDDFVLGFVGRFSPEKRVDLLIETVASLPLDYKLLLVGWGPEIAHLTRMAEEKIPGQYAIATASGYLGITTAMDAFGLVSTQEGCSLAMLEAMMCEVPMILTPVGAVPELILDRINGLVVSPTVPAVSEAVRRLRDYPQWAKGLAAQAKSYADREGHAVRMAQDYADLLERLWAEKQADAPASMAELAEPEPALVG